jgi:integrase
MTAIAPPLERSPQRQHLRLVAPVERHTFATSLAGKGVHPSTAQNMLGHSDIRMTLAIYTHATDEVQDAATAALESAFG